jgi:acyl-coenzyme A synthetase/AMP-(fatty) acid ligase
MPEMSGWSIGGMHLPPFHTLGVISCIIHSMYALSPVVLYPPVALTPAQLPVMPTPDNIIEHLRRTKADSLITIPTLLAIWAQDKESVDFLATLKIVGFSGGSVPTKLGNFMTTQGVVLAPIYGATEFGGPTYMSRRPGGTENDWEWMSIDERTGIRWEPQGDGTYECQFIVRLSSFCLGLLYVNILLLHPDQ